MTEFPLPLKCPNAGLKCPFGCVGTYGSVSYFEDHLFTTHSIFAQSKKLAELIDKVTNG